MAKKIQRSNMVQTDSKGKVLREPRDNSEGMAQNFKWWNLEGEEDMANAIVATVKFIRNHQGPRIEQLTVSSRLYGTSSYSLLGGAFSRSRTAAPITTSGRLSFNLCSSVIDTLSAKMAKNKVVPTYITNGGEWKVQKKAKQLTKFTQGVFYQEKVHKKSIVAFGDAAKWGDGFVHIFEKHDKLCIERTLPHEIFVDEVEGATTNPSQMHRVKIMDRDIALDLFPELEESIKLINPATYQEIGGQGTSADLVEVVESWHLRSGPKAKDGAHCITIGDGCLYEQYDKDYFPFAHFRYVDRPIGWYGQGVCERLQNLQGEVNRGMMTIQKNHWMLAGTKLAVENNSKIVKEHLNNETAPIITFTQTPPMYICPPIMQPEVYTWVDSLIEKGYRQEGVSTLSTTGEAPLGVESGKAMRTLSQIGDDRFMFTSQELEEFTLEIARQSIEVVKEIYERKKTYSVVFPDTKFIETIDWKDIQLDEEQYTLKAYPTSSLSDDLTGRLADVQELAQAGMINPRTARRLMDMPDVEMADNLSNAAEDLLHKIIEEILDDGKVISPEPDWDLQLGKQLTLQYINYAQYSNAPPDRVQALREFNTLIDDLLQAAMPPPMPMPAGGSPQAVPTAPPQSNLLPNAPQQGAA